jgi:hypothetical protein
VKSSVAPNRLTRGSSQNKRTRSTDGSKRT